MIQLVYTRARSRVVDTTALESSFTILRKNTTTQCADPDCTLHDGNEGRCCLCGAPCGVTTMTALCDVCEPTVSRLYRDETARLQDKDAERYAEGPGWFVGIYDGWTDDGGGVGIQRDDSMNVFADDEEACDHVLALLGKQHAWR